MKKNANKISENQVRIRPNRAWIDYILESCEYDKKEQNLKLKWSTTNGKTEVEISITKLKNLMYHLELPM